LVAGGQMLTVGLMATQATNGSEVKHGRLDNDTR